MKTELTISMIEDLQSELEGRDIDIAKKISDDINKEIDHSQKTMFELMSDLYNQRLIGGNLLNVIRFWIMASQDNGFNEITVHNNSRQTFRFILLDNDEIGVHRPQKTKFIAYKRFFRMKWLRFLKREEYSEVLPTPNDVELKYAKMNESQA